MYSPFIILFLIEWKDEFIYILRNSHCVEPNENYILLYYMFFWGKHKLMRMNRSNKTIFSHRNTNCSTLFVYQKSEIQTHYRQFYLYWFLFSVFAVLSIFLVYFFHLFLLYVYGVSVSECVYVGLLYIYDFI